MTFFYSCEKELAFLESHYGADNYFSQVQRAFSLWTTDSTLSGVSRAEKEKPVPKHELGETPPEDNLEK